MANERSITGGKGITGLPGVALFAVVVALAGVQPAAAAQTAIAANAGVATTLRTPANRLDPGTSVRYFVRVENSAEARHGAKLQVASPQGLSIRSWTCSASAGSTCIRANGQGDLDESLDGLATGGVLDFAVDADVAHTPPAFVDIVASASLPAGARCMGGATAPCRSILSLPTGPELDLEIGATAVALSAGQIVEYMLRLHSRSGQASSNGTVLRSPVPKGLTDSSWTCQSNVGACGDSSGTGSIEQRLGDFSAGDVEFRIRAKVEANPPATIVQAAAAAPPYGGTCAGVSIETSTSRSSVCTARIALSSIPRIFATRTPDYSIDGVHVENRFTLENRGAIANGSTVSLAVPPGISDLAWSCTADGATCPQASGSGPIEHTVAAWPTNGILRYDIVSRREIAAGAVLDAAMVVTPSRQGTCGVSELTSPCQVVDLAKPEHPTVRLLHGVDRLGAAPGQTVGFAVDVVNGSTTTALENAVLEVPLPVGIESFTSWTCASIGSEGQCPVDSGSGPIRQLLRPIAAATRLRYSINAVVAQQPPATIAATARLATPASAGLGCLSGTGHATACEARTEFATVPILALDQSRAAGNFASGGMAGYAFEVLNLGADAANVRIDDIVPSGLSSATWVCTGLGIGCPAANGSGKVSALLGQMPAGSGLQYRVSARVDADPPASISNILTALPAPRGRCHVGAAAPFTAMPCIERTETSIAPLLELTQSATQRQLLVGGIADFAVTLKNLGSMASGTLLEIPVPDGIERVEWTCTGFAGAVCPTPSASGPVSETIPALPADGSLNYSMRALISADAATSITQIAEVVPPADGRCADERCAGSVAVPLTKVPSAHLDISMRSARAWAPAGSSPAWTIEVRNLGAETARDFTIGNPVPGGGLSIVSWTCTGIECPAAEGNGPINQTVKSLAVFDAESSDPARTPGRLLFTVTGQLDSEPGPLAKLAVELAPASGDTCAPVGCAAESAVPTSPNGLSEVTIDLQGDTFTATPNSTIQYTFSILNTGGAGLSNVNAYSVEPPQIASSTWTCFGSGVTCPSASGSGAINEIISSMPVSSSLTYSITAQTGGNVQPSVDYQVGVNPGAGVPCNPASCMVVLSIPGEYELSLSLSANVAQVTPDGNVRYTYRVENTGGSAAFGVAVDTVVPQDFVSTSWTCAASAGAFCSPSGTGPINDFISGLPSGASVTYTIDAVAASMLAPIIDFQGGVFNGGQPGGATAPQGGLNCVPPSCFVTLSLPRGMRPPARLSISKTADRSTLDPGGSVRYSVNIANTGTEEARSVQLSDAIPNGLGSFAWTCVASGDVSCPRSSGTGPLNEIYDSLPVGSSLAYTVDATVLASASGTISNRAALVADNIVCTPSSCQAVSALPVQQTAAITVSKSAFPPSGTPVSAGQSIAWRVNASNNGAASSAPLVLTDALPASVSGISVVADPGVSCNTLAPAPASDLVCTIAAGFTGDRGIDITATVSAGVGNAVANTVSASGPDGPACVACTVSNPILQSVDVGIANPRAFSAAGIQGTLIDVANTSPATASATVVTVTPASALRLFATYSGGCTATAGADGSVTVSCPNPPSTQGVSCAGNNCSLASLPQNTAVTLFVALNAGTTATVTAAVPGDADPSDNSIVLPIGGTP